ncbi:MAG: hypothetical protein J07HX5_00223 [halophilic archaeon J07HX5]|nr:MAG: hypothetical protein J07HX5_00223 [halophilic archaeon J07HX5]
MNISVAHPEYVWNQPYTASLTDETSQTEEIPVTLSGVATIFV